LFANQPVIIPGTSGSPSAMTSFTTAVGGGGGGGGNAYYNTPQANGAKPGGSGGGGTQNAPNWGEGTAGQGNPGGGRQGNITPYANGGQGGGGGGASQTGFGVTSSDGSSPWPEPQQRKGGDGVTHFTGFAVGGGGGGGLGGLGGGGPEGAPPEGGGPEVAPPPEGGPPEAGGGEAGGGAPEAPEAPPAAGEEGGSTLLAAPPGKRRDSAGKVITTTPASKGKWYEPVSNRGGDKRDVGARARGFKASGGGFTASPSVKSIFPGFQDIKSLANAAGISETSQEKYRDEEYELFTIEKETRVLLESLETKKNGKT
jgi:hypothetical protein